MTADKRSLILEAAETCFTEKGYHAASMQDIAGQLNMAKGSLYFYFKSKEEMLVEIVKKYIGEFLGLLEAEVDSENPDAREVLVRQLCKRLEFSDSHQKLLPLFMRERIEVTDELFQVISSLQRRDLLLNRRLMLRLYGEAVRPYSFDAATLLISHCEAYLHASLLLPGPKDFRLAAGEIADRLDAVVKSILERKAPPLLPEDRMLNAIENGIDCLMPLNSQAIALVSQLRNSLSGGREGDKNEELLAVLDALETELNSTAPKAVVLKGLTGLLRPVRLPGWKRQLQELERLFLASPSEEDKQP
ncbi:TetR/AcrR family transcriptional regulator [Gorillibacterium sp. sgz500922]|uniref:TetR/AcrR family transcriptional regulator n=1 Tax=Gorillibacterium sp. sgz500922 TaxID=3446694 RepID=UPI003F664906